MLIIITTIAFLYSTFHAKIQPKVLYRQDERQRSKTKIKINHNKKNKLKKINLLKIKKVGNFLLNIPREFVVLRSSLGP